MHPRLPVELIEAILIHVPLRTPLGRSGYGRPSADVHNECAAAFLALPPTIDALKVFLPRMRNGYLQMVLTSAVRKDAHFVACVRSGRFDLPDRVFEVAFVQNRVDVLEWWVNSANLRVYNFRHVNPDVDRRAMQANAWDALDWWAQLGKNHVACDNVFGSDDLAALIRTGGQRQVQFVELWLKAGHTVYGDELSDMYAACELGYVSVLDAWEQGHRVFDYGPFHNEASEYAIRGHGPVIPVLEWMLARGWGMPNIAEYASKQGKIHVLEWWKANKPAIDLAVQNVFQREWGVHDDGDDDPEAAQADGQDISDSDEGEQEEQDAWVSEPEDEFEDDQAEKSDDNDEMGNDSEFEDDDPAEMDFEPEWIMDFKSRTCALDLARENGHEHVLAWWKQNMDLLPMPWVDDRIGEACRRGDLEYLKSWHRRKHHSHDRAYECTYFLAQATKGGHVAVLDWWINESGLRIVYDKDAVTEAAQESEHCQEVLVWWSGIVAV